MVVGAHRVGDTSSLVGGQPEADPRGEVGFEVIGIMRGRDFILIDGVTGDMVEVGGATRMMRKVGGANMALVHIEVVTTTVSSIGNQR